MGELDVHVFSSLTKLPEARGIAALTALFQMRWWETEWNGGALCCKVGDIGLTSLSF